MLFEEFFGASKDTNWHKKYQNTQVCGVFLLTIAAIAIDANEEMYRWHMF